MPSPSLRSLAPLALAGAALVAGCGGDSGSGGDAELRVVATTTQAADFARAVGGDRVEVTQLLQPNSDPHDYEPRPEDVRRTADAQLVIRSGGDLDEWMSDVVKDSGSDAKVVDLSESVPIEREGSEHGHEEEAHGAEEEKGHAEEKKGAADEHAGEEEKGARDEHAGEEEHAGEDEEAADPHWWHDPRNARAAVEELRDAFAAADRDGADTYRGNASDYAARLDALDRGIEECFAAVPEGDRKLVTDHDAFGYFTDRYDIEVVGAVIPGQTTQAQPNARDIARLARLIEQEDVKAIFPQASLNAKASEALARQTGVTTEYELYGDSLGPEDSPAATYLTMEQANADAMVRGFTGGRRGCRIPGIES
jgi:zinc/manganese transport system substrate-binding protein